MVCEMQSVSSGIWTRVTVSISYDDNHNTTGTSLRDIGYWLLPINYVIMRAPYFFLASNLAKIRECPLKLFLLDLQNSEVNERKWMGWVKSLAIFWHCEAKFASMDAYAEVMKMRKPTGLWETELVWLSSSTIRWIILYSWEHSLTFNFRLKWFCLIAEFLSIRAKFVELSG